MICYSECLKVVKSEDENCNVIARRTSPVFHAAITGPLALYHVAGQGFIEERQSELKTDWFTIAKETGAW